METTVGGERPMRGVSARWDWDVMVVFDAQSSSPSASTLCLLQVECGWGEGEGVEAMRGEGGVGRARLPASVLV